MSIEEGLWLWRVMISLAVVLTLYVNMGLARSVSNCARGLSALLNYTEISRKIKDVDDRQDIADRKPGEFGNGEKL